MGMIEWAEREVQIASKRERGDKPEGEWDYGCACYESALKAFKSLCEDEHSGFSICMTKTILNRLIEGKPLTPIEDTLDAWNEVTERREGVTTYQCSRMSSLFKDVTKEGEVTYTDVDRVCCIDVNSQVSYHSGLVSRLINSIYPIKMPYMPKGSYMVYCEDFLTDEKNGDFDTVGVLYLVDPDGNKVEINRFFKESISDFEEISQTEYDNRKSMKIVR